MGNNFSVPIEVNVDRDFMFHTLNTETDKRMHENIIRIYNYYVCNHLDSYRPTGNAIFTILN